ncbi:MAG: helix-turn-helix transcriptional regulator [Rhodocyclaceae bacterium]
MSAPLARIRARLEHDLDRGHPAALPAGMGLFHCRSTQHLHNVPLHHPTLLVVLAGEKQLIHGRDAVSAGAEELMLLPPGLVRVANRPAADRRYLALAITFPREPAGTPPALAEFPPQAETWTLPAPASFGALLEQWLDLHARHAMPGHWHAGRRDELLLSLAATTHAGHLLRSRSNTRDTVLAHISTDLRRDWQVGEVAASLHRSPATLRRQLAREQGGFRALLEEVRMVTALGLLQGTDLPVGLVADRVGYRSASRFAERFRARFGLLPSALRQTQQGPAADAVPTTPAAATPAFQLRVAGDCASVSGDILTA